MNKEEYNRWKNKINENALLRNDFSFIHNDEDINDRFFTSLEFGTGGLRGKMGFGTNRFNHYVIKKVTLAIKDILLEDNKNPSVVIGYDSRNYSKEFASIVASTLAKYNIAVHLFSSLVPTPVVSYSVIKLNADAGIMITASHNPKEYNGYKVYGKDGGQITLEFANRISNKMKNHDYFEEDIESIDKYVKNGLIKLHYEDIFNLFIDSTIKESIYDSPKKDIRILYTPLNGAGLQFVSKLLNKKGYKFDVVKSQEKPDGNFPTCPKPNPELEETMLPSMKEMIKGNYDILFATDPDADRCGVAINYNNDYKLLTGDEVGILLFDFVYHIKKENNTLPKNPIIIKTIATTDILHRMAEKYNVKVIDTLTGFKFIGEQLTNLINNKEDNNFLIGIEDSCGYLTNKEVRDKDSINAALLIAEMANYYKNKGITIYDRLLTIYKEFGNLHSCLKFIELEGEIGKKKINKLLEIYSSDDFYNNFLDCIGKFDYSNRKAYGYVLDSNDVLPRSEVTKFFFKDGSRLLVRGSGTEPKIKFYYLTPSKEKELLIENRLKEEMNKL